ncbi:Plasmodium exported protein (Pm-fam-a like), unknown function [Plasmodium malariae]|uniref:Fam-m protein n=1 Tax=Plasmodium malariae TaxID=5858 RepID=A0A1A8WRV9_PLAMA|nr:Plasmodium exported protein (Pm-fam-a like), unknown function [Plasmodium malariae]
MRTYRLLENCVQNEYSNITGLNEEVTNIGKFLTKDISNNEKDVKVIKKPFSRSSLNKTGFYAEVIDYNNAMFDGKHLHYEKKWIEKKDYDNFVKRDRKVRYMALLKLKDRKVRYMALLKLKYKGYGLIIALFFFFLLFGIGLPTIQYTGFFKTIGKFWKETLNFPGIESWGDGIYNILSEEIINNSFLISYVISIVLLVAVIVILVPKIFINNEKYKKLKLRKEHYG